MPDTAQALILAALKGERPAWPERSNGDLERAVRTLVQAEGLGTLLLDAVHGAPELGWPQGLLGEWATDASRAIAIDALRCQQLTEVLAALEQKRIRTLLFKGAALSHQVYRLSAARPRADSDLLVNAADVDTAGAVLEANGFSKAPAPSGRTVAAQMLYSKLDGRGLGHSIDLHWRPFNRPRYARAFNFDTLWEKSVPVPQLGTSARTPALVDALKIACVHRLAHHSDEERLIWLLDIDRLARQMDTSQWHELSSTATAQGIDAQCASGLLAAHRKFATPIHHSELADSELASHADQAAKTDTVQWRRWLDDLRCLPGWRMRAQFVLELALPGREFMDAVYPGAAPLWLRYLSRGVGRAFGRLGKAKSHSLDPDLPS